jgi:hypothetical protein
MTAGWDERLKATTGFEECRLPAPRLTAWRGFAARCGASTVILGNVAELAEELLAGELVDSARAGLAASGADCAWTEAVYRRLGINTAVKAS